MLKKPRTSRVVHAGEGREIQNSNNGNHSQDCSGKIEEDANKSTEQ